MLIRRSSSAGHWSSTEPTFVDASIPASHFVGLPGIRIPIRAVITRTEYRSSPRERRIIAFLSPTHPTVDVLRAGGTLNRRADPVRDYAQARVVPGRPR